MLEGLIYQFVYNLGRHRLFNVNLRRWLILLCLILPATLWLNLWPASRFGAVLVTLGAAGLLVAMWWAGRRRYVRFESHPSSQEWDINPGTNQHSDVPFLPAMSKTRVRATGHFEVGGMRRYFVEIPAEYTTFETREHCVMTRVPITRFLLLSKSDDYETGWWYTFFQPDMIRSLVSGRLYFGLRPRPALRLEIVQPGDAQGESLYLSFDDEAPRSLVLADLQHDAGLA